MRRIIRIYEKCVTTLSRMASFYTITNRKKNVWTDIDVITCDADITFVIHGHLPLLHIHYMYYDLILVETSPKDLAI